MKKNCLNMLAKSVETQKFVQEQQKNQPTLQEDTHGNNEQQNENEEQEEEECEQHIQYPLREMLPSNSSSSQVNDPHRPSQ